MFSTNGYREFQLTQIARISAAKKAIKAYSQALETGLSFEGKAITGFHVSWLRQAIEDQRRIIQEVKEMPFRVGEW